VESKRGLDRYSGTRQFRRLFPQIYFGPSPLGAENELETGYNRI
jgi:hypothetical protein